LVVVGRGRVGVHVGFVRAECWFELVKEPAGADIALVWVESVEFEGVGVWDKMESHLQ